MNWDLNDLYQGFDEKFLNDVKKLESLVDDYINYLESKEDNDIIYIENYLKKSIDLTVLVRNLYGFVSLSASTNVVDSTPRVHGAKISSILRKTTKADVKFTRYIKKINLKKLAKESSLINDYMYMLTKEQESAKYLLSEKEEVLYSKLQELSSSSWGYLQSLATSNLMIKVNDQEYSFSEVRNFAYESDKELRKNAYYAEIDAYSRVDDFVALALTNIKREVNVLNELRGYKNPIEKTLKSSHMQQKTLDAMLSAMMEVRPQFANYLKAKSHYLGHQGSLPFYDLFAPCGKLDKTYSYQEAQKLVLDSFYSYSNRLGDFAKKAFDNKWIDVLPKKGKRGGAFCSNQPQIKQSRILTNFTGSLSDCLTLAHELGHGYHGEVISYNKPMQWSYPMPLAETASIFCETIVNKHLLSQFAKKEERLSILENSLQSDTQVIIDILSRYLFETKVFAEATKPISKEDMNKYMIDAQIEAYQDGLDPNVLHPYMWLVKGHYYSAGLNFYNFPYAFGLLFAKGLYAQYLKDKEGFIKKYDDLLALTTKAECEDVAKQMKIDITSKDFWLESLSIILQDIDEVIELLN